MTPLMIIFAHFSLERDGAALLECLIKSLQAHGIRPRYVIFTTYQERQNGGKIAGKAFTQVVFLHHHDLISAS